MDAIAEIDENDDSLDIMFEKGICFDENWGSLMLYLPYFLDLLENIYDENINNPDFKYYLFEHDGEVVSHVTVYTKYNHVDFDTMKEIPVVLKFSVIKDFVEFYRKNNRKVRNRVIFRKYFPEEFIVDLDEYIREIK